MRSSDKSKARSWVILLEMVCMMVGNTVAKGDVGIRQAVAVCGAVAMVGKWQTSRSLCRILSGIWSVAISRWYSGVMLLALATS